MSRLSLTALLVGIAAASGTAVFVTTRAQSSSSTAPAGTPPASTTNAAIVNGQPISNDDLEAALGAELTKLEQDLYNLKRGRLEEMIGEKLMAAEAAKRGVDVDTLLATEVEAKIAPVTEDEVNSFYETNKARLPNVADIRQQIRSFLENQRGQTRRQEFLTELRSGASVEMLLSTPPIRRAQVDIEGAPVRGAVSAPVTIVEFSDFHCPFCKRVQATLTELLSRYEGKVRLVYKDLPLDSLHPQARRASEAARCAGDQGKFWEFHDKIYAGGPDASPEYLRKVATDVGLDVTGFEQCLGSSRHDESIERDLQQAAGFGLNGTPAFFINGRPLSGAQPLEAFVAIIDEELQLQASAAR